MKKRLLVLTIVLLSIGSVEAQVGYGIKAGVNLGKYLYDSNLLQEDVKRNPSFYVTGYTDISIAPNFTVQPGVSLQGKGGKRKSEGPGTETVSSTQNILAIEIPVNAVYYIPTGGIGSIFVGAGPYIGYAISGKYKVEWSGFSYIDDPTFEGSDYPFEPPSGSRETDVDFKIMKRFDTGINFLIGYTLSNGFLVNAGYGLGLTNLSKHREPKLSTEYSNRVLSFGLGFQF